MFISASTRKIILYSATILFSASLVIQVIRVIHISRTLKTQNMYLKNEKIQLKHIEQYTDAINYINSSSKIQDFSAMLNFRIHDIAYVKLLNSKDEANRFKRKVQITCRTIEQLHQAIHTLSTLDSCICFIDKLSYERSKDTLIVTMELTYIYNQ